jgi:hypothetical protein
MVIAMARPRGNAGTRSRIANTLTRGAPRDPVGENGCLGIDRLVEPRLADASNGCAQVSSHSV